jgi:hypothetical protein
MHLVGVVEILAGVLVALKPRYAAYVVAAWLAGIIVNLLTGRCPRPRAAGADLRSAGARGAAVGVRGRT